MATFYAQRKSIKGGEPQAISNRFGSYAEMLRQYFLYCASAATNQDANDYDSIEFGTVEGGVIKTERFDNTPANEAE
jgi:hypothetical protein